MTKHLRFLIVLLLTLVWSTGWAQTTIWSEDWTGKTSGTQPKNMKYDNVVYSNKFSKTKIVLEDLAGGTAPELLLSGKSDAKDTWTVTINDLKGCYGEYTLSLYTNNSNLSSVKVNGSDVTLSTFKVKGENRTATFTVKDGTSSLKLEFTPSSNTRIDNVVLTATSAGESKTATNVSFSSNSNKTFTFTEGKLEGFTAPKATETNNVAGTITYSSNNESAVKVNASTGELSFPGYGEATITATFTPNNTETYAVSTDSYKVKNERGVVAGTITFDKANGAFDVLNPNNKGYGTAKYNFVSDTNESYTFDCKDVMKTSANNGCLQIKKNTGKVASPVFPKFTNGYKVNIIYSSKKALQLSAGDANVVIGTTTSSNNTNGLGASVSISIPANVPFVITSGGSEVTYVSKIEIIPNKIDEAETLTLYESANNTIEAKTGVNVTLKRSMVANEWNTICLPFDVTEKQAKAAFGDEVKIAELDTEAAVDANVLSFKASTVITAATPYLIKPSAVSETGTYTFDGVDIAEKNVNDKYAYTFNLSVNNPISFKGIYNKVDINEDVQKSFTNNYAAFLGAGNKIYKAGTGMTKGFRAYFAIPKSASASALRVVIDGTATSIKNIDSEVVESNAPVYNLQGQRVNGNNLTPGIYVKAGKKFVVK